MVHDGLLAQVPVEIQKWTKVRRDGGVVESPGGRSVRYPTPRKSALA
jgi:hypothetical protein